MMEVIWNGAHGDTNADLFNGPWHQARPLPALMQGATTTGQILAVLQPGEVVTSREMWARLQADPAPGYFSVSTSMARLVRSGRLEVVGYIQGPTGRPAALFQLVRIPPSWREVDPGGPNGHVGIATQGSGGDRGACGC